MKLDISLYIPVYNGESTIESVLKSALDLDPGPSEIIVINDGSTDNTLEILNKYKEQIILLEDRSELIDFNIVNYFKNIAISNSTFNWWSIFFQEELNNKKIFTPKFIGYFGIGDKFKSHGEHIKNLCNIRNISIPVDNEFINLG